MGKFSLTLLAAATIGLTVSQASAADLPRKAPAYVPPPAPPAYVWTGCYLGGNVGGAWAHLEVTDQINGASVSRSNSGFAGGGQIGCDYQIAAWVIGIRNMFDGTSISHSTTFFDPLLVGGTGTVDTKVRWFDALTGRVGYLLQPNLLLYGQGGAAWTSANVTVLNGFGQQVGEISGNSRTGWTAGGGVEWMFVPHWSVFVEYNFMGFERSSGFTCFVNCGNAIFNTKADIQNVLLGVNYKF